MKYYVFGHGPCPDGTTALWVAQRNFNRLYPNADVKFASIAHGESLPELVNGSTIFFLDYAPSLEVIKDLQTRMHKVYVIDHHQTAVSTLAGKVEGVLDVSKSGAKLTADYFKEPNPFVNKIVDYVQDRDLWKHALPNSEEINNYLCTYAVPYSQAVFSAFEQLYRGFVSTGDMLEAFRERGHRIGEHKRTVIEAAVARAFDVIVGGETFKCVNVTPEYVSNVLDRLLKNSKADLVIGFYKGAEPTYNYSVRTTPARDAAVFCEQYGGGGHARAAGFRSRLAPTELARIRPNAPAGS